MTDGRNRGGCLTAWLVLMIIGATFASISNFFLHDTLGRMATGFRIGDEWVLIAWGVLALVQLIAAVALMLWKKWGFYAVAATAVASLGIQIYLGFPIYLYIYTFVGPLILYLLMKPMWHKFDSTGRSIRYENEDGSPAPFGEDEGDR